MKRILGLLGWLGVVLVVAAVLIRFTKPEWQPWYQWLAIAGLVVTALYALSQWRDIGRSFQGRNIKYGSIAIGGIVIFLGILAAINWIASRENKRWDLTAGQQFTLSEQTRKLLTDLKSPLQMRVYYEPGHDRDYRDRLAEFEYYSKQVKVEFIDAVKDPLRARSADVQNYGTIVLEHDGRTEKVTTPEEQDLANAIKKIVVGQSKKLYFTQGHGERDPDVNDQTGYAGIAKQLKSDNFETAKVTIAQEGKVPDDASVVVVAGPKRDLLAAEVDLLRAFLKRGGKVILLIDPPEKLDAPPLTNVIALAKEWGINVGNDFVVDASGLGQVYRAGPYVPIAQPAPGGHPIVDRFKYMTAYPLARSVTPIEGGTDGKVAQKLLETHPRSWAETDFKSAFVDNKQPEPNFDKGDKAGPVSIAAAVSAAAPDAPAPATPGLPKPDARVVVVGDSDFIANGALKVADANGDMFLNMANWAAQQEALISIRPRDPQDRRITMTRDEADRIFWLTFVIIPAALIGNGVRVWWRRR